MTPTDYIQIATAVISLGSAGCVLYVSYRLLTFKAELIKEINGTYVRTPLFDQWKKDAFDELRVVVERIRKWREHDYHEEITPIPLLVHGQKDLTKRVERIEDRLAGERGDA